MKTCPHCHQPIMTAPAELVALLADLRLPRKERLVADELLSKWPRLVRTTVLVGILYDDEGEAIPEPEHVLYSHVSKLRSKLRQRGWTIESQRFGGYRFAEAA